MEDARLAELLDIAQTLRQSQAQLSPELRAAAVAFWQALRAEYTLNGAIYGDTVPGITRWVRERADVERYLDTIDKILKRHSGQTE